MNWSAWCTTPGDAFGPLQVAVMIRRADQPESAAQTVAVFPTALDPPNLTSIGDLTAILGPGGTPLIDNHPAGYRVELRASLDVCNPMIRGVPEEEEPQSVHFPHQLESRLIHGHAQIPSGSLSNPSPFPCVIQPGQSGCNTTINWSGTDTSGMTLCRWRMNYGASTLNVWGCSGQSSGSSVWEFSSLVGHKFELRAHQGTPPNTQAGYDAGILLDDIIVEATAGTLHAPNPVCQIPSGGQNCQVTLNWTAENAPNRVLRRIRNGQLQGTTALSSSPVTVSATEGSWEYQLAYSSATGAPVLASTSVSVIGGGSGCTQPPSGPVLVGPQDEQPTSALPPLFQWNSVSGAQNYRIRAWELGNFGQPLVDTTTTGTSHQAGAQTGFQPDTTYQWEVEARHSNWCFNPTSATMDTIFTDGGGSPPGNADPETPPQPIPDPLFTSDPSSARVGTVRGEFRVDESGAATYSIPVMVAPGSGGLTPEVALSYSSHGGVGLAGMGWEISGLSTISRCGQAPEFGDLHQGEPHTTGVRLDASDRFCLDGRRLQVVSGSYGAPNSVYRLEVDDFTRVTAHGNLGGSPTHFTVQRKDGTTSTYGSSSSGHSARIRAPGINRVVAWPISRFQDSANNYFDVEYIQPGAPSSWIEWVPHRIRYTGNTTAGTLPYAEIEFAYTTKATSEQQYGYLAGEPTRSSRRLIRIDSFGESVQLIRQYRLGYTADAHGRQVLDQVRECWGVGSNDCFLPTTFEWLTATLRTPNPTNTGLSAVQNFHSAQAGDVTGNGRQDTVYLRNEGGIARFGVIVSQPNGTLTRSADVPPPCSLSASDLFGWQLVDLWGTGRLGLVYAANCSSGPRRIYYHQWSENLNRFASASAVADLPANLESPALHAMDWNGDGLTDLILSDKDYLGGETNVPLWVYENFAHTGPSQLHGPKSVNGVFSWIPPAEPCTIDGQPGFPVRVLEFDLLDAPLAEVDMSGRVAFAGRAVMTEWCSAIHSEAELLEGMLEEGMSRTEAEIAFEDLELTSVPLVRTAIWQITQVTPTHAQSSMYAQFNNLHSDARILPVDVNADGYSDFIVIQPRDGTPSTHDIHLYINSGLASAGAGTGTLLYRGVQHSVNQNVAPHIRIMDYDGDGYPDLLIPSNHNSASAVWRVHRWVPGSHGIPNSDNGCFCPGPLNGPTAGNLSNNDQSVFLDRYGNGKNSLVAFRHQSGSWQILAAQGASTPTTPQYTALGNIRRFTDGFGAWTEIEYKSLAQRTVYTRDNNGPYAGYGNGSIVYDVVMPMYVVSAATSLAPQYVLNVNATGSTAQLNGTARVEYYYTGAKLQGGGRGFLGFAQVASYDPQSGMLTRTRYRQQFPYIGLPEATTTWYRSANPWPSTDNLPNIGLCQTGSCANTAINAGVILGQADNEWALRATATGVGHPYLAQSSELSYAPAYSGSNLTSSTFTHRVVTITSNVDVYGNPGNVTVNTYSTEEGVPGGLLAQQESSHVYSNYPATWILGRLTCSTVTSYRSDGGGIQQRRSGFEYDTSTGQLIRELVQPTACTTQGFANAAVDTTHALDNFGNRTVTTVSGPDFSDRLTRRSYDSRGRFVDVRDVHVAGNWREVERVLSRNRFGSPAMVRNGQGVTTHHYYDLAGRPHYTYAPDGSWESEEYLALSIGCPQGTAYQKVLGSSARGQGHTRLCKDVLDREVRSINRGFDLSWIYQDTRYDYASRPVESSQPAYAGESMHWTRTVYDEIGRVEFVRNPDLTSDSWYYEGLTTTYTNALNQTRQITRNVFGEKVSETAPDGGITTYTYDALGQLLTTDGPLSGTQDRIQIQYNALGQKIRVTDPDKGIWHYHYNGLGELICQRDASNNGIYMTYDPLGRMLTRIERTGVTNVTTCAGTNRGSTSWFYGNGSQNPEFGQVTAEINAHQTLHGAPQTALGHAYSYDSLGRLQAVTTQVTEGSGSTEFARTYTQHTTYDQFGRVFQQFDASGDSRGVRYLYNSHGYLSGLREAREGTQGQMYWQVQAMDARGNVTQALLGNGISTHASHDAATGRLLDLWTQGDAGLLPAVDLELIWDAIGNLVYRHDYRTPVQQSEWLVYDNRNRLEQVRHQAGGTGGWITRQRLRYDVSGNILCKSDVSAIACSSSGHQNYTYGAGSAGPHAVTAAGSNRTFEYDANGNVLRDRVNGTIDRQFYYTAFDKLRRVSSSGRTTEFHYGPSRGRMLKRELVGNTVESRTHYVGSVEVVWEGTSPAPGTGEYRRSIGGVALVTFYGATELSQVRYRHTDHLGSLVALSDAGGQVVARMGFDAWGQRRNPEQPHPPWVQWTQPPPVWAGAMLAITPRGYTGHEHVDDHGIIHMNGRIYDAHLARFLQADPFIEDTSTLNRYTYVHNNPLAYTDPSGYFSFKKWTPHRIAKRTTRGFMRAIGPEASSALISFGSYFCGPYAPLCAAAGNYELTRAYGGSYRDGIRNGAVAGASQYAFGGGSEGMTATQAAAQASMQVVAAQYPEVGQALMFVYGNWGNPNPSMWFQDAAGRGMQYAAARELEKRAEGWGLTLGELNAILAVNSWVGRNIAGTTYTPDYASGTGTVEGFFSRHKHRYLGAIWDVNDTLLNVQGLPDAVTRQIMHDPRRPSHLTGHSLGAWRVNNLMRMGYIESGTLLSLPGLAYPAPGTTGVCATRDVICGTGVMSWLRPSTTNVSSRGLITHRICSVEGYSTRWPGTCP